MSINTSNRKTAAPIDVGMIQPGKLEACSSSVPLVGVVVLLLTMVVKTDDDVVEDEKLLSDEKVGTAEEVFVDAVDAVEIEDAFCVVVERADVALEIPVIVLGEVVDTETEVELTVTSGVVTVVLRVTDDNELVLEEEAVVKLESVIIIVRATEDDLGGMPWSSTISSYISVPSFNGDFLTRIAADVSDFL